MDASGFHGAPACSEHVQGFPDQVDFLFLFSLYKVSPTKSSKLRKQSARRRIKVLDGLPPSRRDELQAYAGQYLPKSSSKKSSARPKKVLHQSEWQT